MKTKSGIIRMTKAAVILLLTMTIQLGYGQSMNRNAKKKNQKKTYRCELVGVQKVKHIQGRPKVSKALLTITPSNNILTASITETKPELLKPEILAETEEDSETIIPEPEEIKDSVGETVEEDMLSLLPQPVYFRYDSYRLDMVDLTQIALAVNCVKAGKKIQVVGHTDNWGGERYNQALSLRRANIIRDMMIKLGCSPESIEAKGEGEKFPKTTNEHEVGRQSNRRVEFIILPKVN